MSIQPHRTFLHFSKLRTQTEDDSSLPAHQFKFRTMDESKSRKTESDLPSSSSTAEQSSADNQESKEHLSNAIHQRCLQLIKKTRERIINSEKTASRLAFASTVFSSSIPIFYFILTMKTSSNMEGELSSHFEDMSLKVLKATTYVHPSNDKSSMDALQEDVMNGLNEIERIMLEEYYKNEKAVANTKELCMAMVFLHCTSLMPRFESADERRAFIERLMLDRYFKEIQNKLESLDRVFEEEMSSAVLDLEDWMKDCPAYLREILNSLKPHAIGRDSAYLTKLEAYFKPEDIQEQYEKFINEEKAKAKSGSRSRKLLLNEMENEKKIAMQGIKKRLDKLKTDIEDEFSNAVNMISFCDVIISCSCEILSYIVKIPLMPREQASSEGMKYELTSLFGKMRQNMSTAIKNTASCSTSQSRSHTNKRLKERIRANIKNMELSIRNNVVNSRKIEEGNCLKVLCSIANVFLPTIDRSIMYARNYDGTGPTFDLQQCLGEIEKELKERFENLIMKT